MCGQGEGRQTASEPETKSLKLQDRSHCVFLCSLQLIQLEPRFLSARTTERQAGC